MRIATHLRVASLLCNIHFGTLKKSAVFPIGKFNNVMEGNIEGRIEVTGRRGRRHKKLLNDIQEKRGCCKLKKEAVDRTL
jgi:hypothetical protein